MKTRKKRRNNTTLKTINLKRPMENITTSQRKMRTLLESGLTITCPTNKI